MQRKSSILKQPGYRLSIDQKKNIKFNVAENSPVTPRTMDYRKNSGLRNTKEVRRSSKNVDIAIDQLKQIQSQNLCTISDEVPNWQIPIRIAMGLIFAVDIGTDINLTIEVYQFSDETSHFLSMVTIMLIYWVIGGVCTTFLTRNKEIPNDIPSEKLGIVFMILAFFGIDTIFYYFYSAITKQLHSEYENYCNQANSSRKIWGTVQSILSSFLCAHYLFTKPLEHSNWAIAGMIFSMSNAGITLFVTLNQMDFQLWFKECILSLRCLSIIPEVIGRPLFFGITTLVIIEKSNFLQSGREYYLTYDFFGWNALALLMTCVGLLVIDLVRGLPFIKSFTFLPLIFTSALIQRPPTDLEVFKVKGLISKYILGIADMEEKDRIYHTKLHFCFPLFWRICEYAAFVIVMQDLELLSRAEKYQVKNLAYNSLIWNLINLIMVIVCFILTIRSKDEAGGKEEKMSKVERGLMNQIEFARRQSLLPAFGRKQYHYSSNNPSKAEFHSKNVKLPSQKLQKSQSVCETIPNENLIIQPLDPELLSSIMKCDSGRKKENNPIKELASVNEQDNDQTQAIENNNSLISQKNQKKKSENIFQKKISKDIELESIGLEIPQGNAVRTINYNSSQQQQNDI